MVRFTPGNNTTPRERRFNRPEAITARKLAELLIGKGLLQQAELEQIAVPPSKPKKTRAVRRPRK